MNTFSSGTKRRSELLQPDPISLFKNRLQGLRGNLKQKRTTERKRTDLMLNLELFRNSSNMTLRSPRSLKRRSAPFAYRARCIQASSVEACSFSRPGSSRSRQENVILLLLHHIQCTLFYTPHQRRQKPTRCLFSPRLHSSRSNTLFWLSSTPKSFLHSFFPLYSFFAPHRCGGWNSRVDEGGRRAEDSPSYMHSGVKSSRSDHEPPIVSSFRDLLEKGKFGRIPSPWRFGVP